MYEALARGYDVPGWILVRRKPGGNLLTNGEERVLVLKLATRDEIFDAYVPGVLVLGVNETGHIANYLKKSIGAHARAFFDGEKRVKHASKSGVRLGRPNTNWRHIVLDGCLCQQRERRRLEAERNPDDCFTRR